MDAGATLTSSLDYAQTVENLAELVVRSLATFCVIVIASEESSVGAAPTGSRPFTPTRQNDRSSNAWRVFPFVGRRLVVAGLARRRRMATGRLGFGGCAFEGVQFDAEYRPGNAEATIGVDWYDAFVIDDGRVVVTVGDVFGKGLQAALAMTKLRQAMQSAAMVHPEP